MPNMRPPHALSGTGVLCPRALFSLLAPSPLSVQRGVSPRADSAAFVEGLCAVFYASRLGRPSLRPGRYFQLLFIGYFEGLSSERGIAWRVADSLSLRAFLDLDVTEAPPNHSTLSRTRRLGRLSALWGRLTASWDFQWTPAGLVGSIAHRQAA